MGLSAIGKYVATEVWEQVTQLVPPLKTDWGKVALVSAAIFGTVIFFYRSSIFATKSVEQLRRTLVAGTEGNPLQNSVAQLLIGALSGGPTREAFIWGSSEVPWGKEVRPFDLLANKYHELSTENKENVLRLAAEFFQARVSIPQEPKQAGVFDHRAQFVADMQLLIAGVKAEWIAKHLQLADGLEQQIANLPKSVPAEKFVAIKGSALKIKYNLQAVKAVASYCNMSAALHGDLAQLDPGDKESCDRYSRKFTAVSDLLLNQFLLDKKQAVKNYGRAVKMGKFALERNDFEIAMVILAALENASVNRLALDERLSQCKKEALGNLRDLFNPLSSHKNYRRKVGGAKSE